MSTLLKIREDAEQAIELATKGHGRSREAKRLLMLLNVLEGSAYSREREALNWIIGFCEAKPSYQSSDWQPIVSRAKAALRKEVA